MTTIALTKQPLIRLIVVATLALALCLTTAPEPASAMHTAEPSASKTAAALKLPDTGPIVKTIFKYVKKGGNIQAAVDKCRGPVIARLGYPTTAKWLLPMHNYCGGLWILKVKKGKRIKIRNGKLAGIYIANGKTKIVKRGTNTSKTKGLGFLVMQTCIPGTNNMKLVGLRKKRKKK